MTVLDSGFHVVDSGFQLLDSGFQLSGFRIPKRAGFQFFFCFNAFLRISFTCSNLAILKDVVRMHNKSVFFFDLQITGRMYYSFVRFYGLLMRWTLVDCPHRNAAEKKNKKITNTPSPQIETKIYNIIPHHFEEQLHIIHILTRCFYTSQKSKAKHLFFKFKPL